MEGNQHITYVHKEIAKKGIFLNVIINVIMYTLTTTHFHLKLRTMLWWGQQTFEKFLCITSSTFKTVFCLNIYVLSHLKVQSLLRFQLVSQYPSAQW